MKSIRQEHLEEQCEAAVKVAAESVMRLVQSALLEAAKRLERERRRERRKEILVYLLIVSGGVLTIIGFALFCAWIGL